MDEDYYALSKLARTVFRTNDLDHRRAGGIGAASAERHAAADPMAGDVQGRRARRRDPGRWVSTPSRRCRSCICACGRPRSAGRGSWSCTLGARVCTTWRHTCSAPPATRHACWPEASTRSSTKPSPPLRGAGDGAVVLAGERPGRRRRRQVAADAGARFEYVTRRANDRGALLAGCTPRCCQAVGRCTRWTTSSASGDR